MSASPVERRPWHPVRPDAKPDVYLLEAIFGENDSGTDAVWGVVVRAWSEEQARDLANDEVKKSEDTFYRGMYLDPARSTCENLTTGEGTHGACSPGGLLAMSEKKVVVLCAVCWGFERNGRCIRCGYDHFTPAQHCPCRQRKAVATP